MLGDHAMLTRRVAQILNSVRHRYELMVLWNVWPFHELGDGPVLPVGMGPRQRIRIKCIFDIDPANIASKGDGNALGHLPFQGLDVDLEDVDPVVSCEDVLQDLVGVPANHRHVVACPEPNATITSGLLPAELDLSIGRTNRDLMQGVTTLKRAEVVAQAVDVG